MRAARPSPDWLRAFGRIRALFLWLLVSTVPALGAEPASDCVSGYAKFGSSSSQGPDSRPALGRLEAYLEKQALPTSSEAEKFRHAIERVGDRVILKIGLLEKRDKQFMVLVLSSIREGSIHEIDAGAIIGPKALALMNRLRALASEEGKSIIFKGRLQPGSLVAKMEEQIAKSPRLRPGDPERWLPQDIADFKRAIADFKVLEACTAKWKVADLGQCKAMEFEFNSLHPASFRWR